MNDVLFVGLLVLVSIFVFVLTPKLDRDRIRENIEAHGGRVIEILRAWGSGTRYDRAYEVSYMTACGDRVRATCRTSMWNGVDWVNNRPPGLDSGEADVPSTSYVAEDPPGAPEPIQCLGCGATMLASQVSCPKCGWSYRAHQAGQ
jgi:hypothetical protein